MRKLFLAAGLCLSFAAPAEAGARETALNHLAQVFAAQKLCPSLEVNQGLALLIAAKFDVDFERDQTELLKQVADQAAPWKGNEDAACVAGLLLYGPKGSSIPDLLKMK
ncbi:MAG: hypothetical protein JZU55_00880 [Afipia sp.]|nr:hypothetical protein [Afipia sp.]